MAVLFELKPDEQHQLKLAERDVEEDLLEATDKMIARGINVGEVKKLQDAGIYTCNGLIMHTKKNLTGIKGLLEEQSQLQLVEREDFEDEEDSLEIQKSALCRTTICSRSKSKRMIARGIYGGEVKNLQDAGIYTCNGLMMHAKKNLTGIKGLSNAKVDMICEAAEKIVNFGYITGSDALLRRKAVIRITTGSQAVDEFFGGGIETLLINEAFGEFRSWKTQIAHTLCVSTQLPTSMRGGNGKVAYIDTEGTFRPDRILPITKRFGMDPGAVLDNIIYAREYSYEHQYKLLLGLAAKMSKETFGLLIAEEFNAACQNSEPASLAHDASVRLIMFRKGKGEQRICKNYVFTMSTPKITCIICLMMLLFIEGVSADVAPVPEEAPVPEDVLAAAVHGFVRRHGILRTILYALGAWFVGKILGIIDDYFTGWLRYLIMRAFNFLRPRLGEVYRNVWEGLRSRLAAVARRVREVFVFAYTRVPNVANGANPTNP